LIVGRSGVNDCDELRQAFRQADAEFRAEVGKLADLEVQAITDAMLGRLAELDVARSRAWDAYIDCVRQRRREGATGDGVGERSSTHQKAGRPS
jgi:hypothetical protein